MNYDRHLDALPWEDYALLDSGENMKLERFGQTTVARPETQALWKKLRPELWKEAHAVFSFGSTKGAWDVHRPLPEPWTIAWHDARLAPKLTGFKHTGIFPEQAPNWAWLEERVEMLEQSRVLNLFGYTGMATLVMALRGASVTHVDASKQSLDWAHENARLSAIGEEKIRWILDDALAFARREKRRGAVYDGIVLDPPAFGRGAKGEVWKIEEGLPELLATLVPLLGKRPGSFFLINGYAAGYAARSFAQAVESAFGPVKGDCGELHIHESGSERVVPSGIYCRFVR